MIHSYSMCTSKMSIFGDMIYFSHTREGTEPQETNLPQWEQFYRISVLDLLKIKPQLPGWHGNEWFLHRIDTLDLVLISPIFYFKTSVQSIDYVQSIVSEHASYRL